MATFENLEIDKFYLIRVKEEDEITMVQVGMATDKCVLVYEFDDDYEATYWKKKDDQVAEIVEELTDEHIDEYESLLVDEWDEDDDEDDDDEDRKKKKKKKK
jgi:predicted NAD/FAD-dependent oxidoreductase